MIKITPRTIGLSALGLLFLAVVGGGGLGGPEFAGGVAAAGGVALLNLAAWTALVRRMIASTLAGTRGARTAVLFALKPLLLAAVLFGLVLLFPFRAVVLGSSVVVGAAVAVAFIGFRVSLDLGDA